MILQIEVTGGHDLSLRSFATARRTRAISTRKRNCEAGIYEKTDRFADLVIPDIPLRRSARLRWCWRTYATASQTQMRIEQFLWTLASPTGFEPVLPP